MNGDRWGVSNRKILDGLRTLMFDCDIGNCHYENIYATESIYFN